MNSINSLTTQTYNATDIRFRLGQILEELEKEGKPVLIISRSKPRGWLLPYEEGRSAQDLFMKWQKETGKKYGKIKAKDLVALIRQDRDR